MALHISTGPHLRAKDDTQRLMLDVLIALLPATAASIYFFGLKAALIIVVSVAAAVLSEYVWQRLAHKPLRIGDLSAAVTGLLLALNLPANVPLWIPLIGSAFAIIIVKQLFGGIGHNFLNPALAARAVLLTSWPSHMTKAFDPQRLIQIFGASTVATGVDSVASATPLNSLYLSGSSSMSVTDLLVGNMPGAIGETCKLAILLGLLYLLVRKVISWEIPVVMLCVTALSSWALGIDPLKAVLTGGVLFGACFMATDYVTSPMLKTGHIIYAAGAGLLVTLIRKFGNYPEGVTYAILLMNIVTPLIDRSLKRKVYGEVKQHG